MVLLILTSLRLPFLEPIKNGLSDGFIPFLVFSSRVQGSLALLTSRFKGYSDLQSENTELAKKLGELSLRVAQVGEMERENQEFRAMLEFKERTDLKLMSAKVIGRDPSNWWNTILIDRGEADGIAENMPVLTVEGLVGKTIDVGKNNSRVILVVDENCKESGWLSESAVYGIVEGNILAGGKASQCRMTFLDRSATVKKGEKVLTSGLGGIFPKGILIGTVSSVTTGQDPSRNALYREVNITPAVDLARIDEVFIGIGVKPPAKVKPPKPSGKAAPAKS